MANSATTSTSTPAAAGTRGREPRSESSEPRSGGPVRRAAGSARPGPQPARRPASGPEHRNVGQRERIASTLVGSALLLTGLTRGRFSGLLLSAVGASLAYRGWTGHCRVYESLGIDTADRGDRAAVPAQRGVKVEESVVINRPADELFAFWREVENLPSVFEDISRIESITSTTSRWTAEGPLGVTLQWEAEIFHEREPELIAWRSLPGSQVETAGSVRFETLGHDRGTAVRVSLKYAPPAGKLTDRVASLFGSGAEQRIREDLRSFKRRMETGEHPRAVVHGSRTGG